MRKIITLSVLLLAMSFTVFAQTKTNQKISDVQAFLIYEENGGMSKNILDTDFALWNVIIGEGDAEGHSSATMVHVVVSQMANPRKHLPFYNFQRFQRTANA